MVRSRFVLCPCGKHGRVVYSSGQISAEVVSKDLAVQLDLSTGLSSSEAEEIAWAIKNSSLPSHLRDVDAIVVERLRELTSLRLTDPVNAPKDSHAFLFPLSRVELLPQRRTLHVRVPALSHSDPHQHHRWRLTRSSR